MLAADGTKTYVTVGAAYGRAELWLVLFVLPAFRGCYHTRHAQSRPQIQYPIEMKRADGDAHLMSAPGRVRASHPLAAAA